MQAIIILLLILVSTTANAQVNSEKNRTKTSQTPPQATVRNENDTAPSMQTSPLIERMINQQMMVRDLMHMTMDIARIQGRLIEGTSGLAEEEKMVEDLASIRERISNMLVASLSAGAKEPQAGADSKLERAREQLEEAINIQARHIANPDTVTQASQCELLQQLKNAHDSLQDAPDQVLENSRAPEK